MRKVNFSEKEAPLREDVRVLGALVGEVLAEQRGVKFFELVEAVTRAAILRREVHAGASTTYFQVVNLAEKVHRIRRRREYLRRGVKAQPGGLLAVMQELGGRDRPSSVGQQQR